VGLSLGTTMGGAPKAVQFSQEGRSSEPSSPNTLQDAVNTAVSLAVGAGVLTCENISYWDEGPWMEAEGVRQHLEELNAFEVLPGSTNEGMIRQCAGSRPVEIKEENRHLRGLFPIRRGPHTTLERNFSTTQLKNSIKLGQRCHACVTLHTIQCYAAYAIEAAIVEQENVTSTTFVQPTYMGGGLLGQRVSLIEENSGKPFQGRNSAGERKEEKVPPPPAASDEEDGMKGKGGGKGKQSNYDFGFHQNGSQEKGRPSSSTHTMYFGDDGGKQQKDAKPDWTFHQLKDAMKGKPDWTTKHDGGRLGLRPDTGKWPEREREWDYVKRAWKEEDSPISQDDWETKHVPKVPWGDLKNRLISQDDWKTKHVPKVPWGDLKNRLISQDDWKTKHVPNDPWMHSWDWSPDASSKKGSKGGKNDKGKGGGKSGGKGWKW
jgi:hypothetical protein